MFSVILIIGVFLADGKLDVVRAVPLQTMQECEEVRTHKAILETYPKHVLMCVEVKQK